MHLFRVTSFKVDDKRHTLMNYEWIVSGCDGKVYMADKCSGIGRGEVVDSGKISFSQFFISIDLGYGCCRIAQPINFPSQSKYRHVSFKNSELTGEGALYRKHLRSFF